MFYFGGVYIFEELKLSNPAMFAAVCYRHERLVVSGLTMCECAHAFNTQCVNVHMPLTHNV